MNKLRELWLRQANTTGQQYDMACADICDYLWDNREYIADLIDAAQHLVMACTPSFGYDGVRIPNSKDVAQLRDAIAKLEDK